jgi:hypothetical protein
MINVDFGNLFTVELLHQFYANLLCPDFSITPSVKTQQVLNNHKAIAKQYKNQLIVGLKTEAYTGIQSTLNPISLKPFTKIDTGLQMTFFMSLNNSLFFNYTNLPSASSVPGNIYYFTNRNNNLSNGKNLLSSKILPYQSASTYMAGDLVVDGTGTVFCAILSSNSGSPFGTADANHWVKIDTNQYPTAADVLQWMPTKSTYRFDSPQNHADISVLGYDTGTGLYTKSFISKTINFNSTLPSFTIDLSSLDTGKYFLTVNGLRPQWIYINDELSSGTTFGVIDIYHDALPSPAQLVDGTPLLLSPKYSIYFLNRATIWKYTLVSPTAGSISVPLNKYQFANTLSSTQSFFISQTPIPLTDTPLQLTLTLGVHQYTPIACADPQRLTNIKQAGDNYPCSEIFLNY